MLGRGMSLGKGGMNGGRGPTGGCGSRDPGTGPRRLLGGLSGEPPVSSV